jgi:hypothetical protein
MAVNAALAPALPLAPPGFTVRDAMVVCGVNDETLFDGDTATQRIAADLFGDDFATCMDKSFTELDSEFKTYSDLTQNQGQVRLLPGTKHMIKAFIQWVRVQYADFQEAQRAQAPGGDCGLNLLVQSLLIFI